MKRIILFILLGMLSVELSAQENMKPVLAGIWTVDTESQKNSMALSKDNNMGEMPESVVRESLRTMNSRMYSFGPEGEFEASWISGSKHHSVSGSYSVTGNELEINLGGRVTLYRYSVNINKLTLISTVARGSRPAVLHLKSGML